MRASRRLAQLAAVAVTLSVAGCAVGSSPSSPHVSLNISAPTAGATVGVHQVTVTGSVQPLTASVNVNGRPARVAGGIYSESVYVSSSSQKITVSAAARGFMGAQATTTVGYSPSTAAQLVASAKTLKSQPAAVTAKLASANTNRAINAMFNIPTPGSGTGHKPKPSAPSGGPGGANGSGTTTGSGPSTPSGGTASGGGSSTGSTGNSSSTPKTPPPPTPQQIARAIRKAWVHGCIPHRKGENVAAYCTCTYTQLQHHNNLLSTRVGVRRWNRWIRPYLRTGDFTKLPRFVQRAVSHCIDKFPPPDPLSGSTVRPLPGGSHTGAPASNQPISSMPSQPSAPTPPSAPTSSTSSTSTSTTSTSSTSTTSTSTTSTSSQTTTTSVGG